MASFPRLSLRMVWHPAPGWPPQPHRFAPPPGWSPDPRWPAAPPGWTGWRPRWGLLVAATVTALISVLTIVGVVQASVTARDVHALQQRGAAMTANLLSSSYDPDGGDPDGWTTDTVQFRDQRGNVERAVVGHHGDDHTEQTSRTIPIVYEPAHPGNVMSAQQLETATPDADLAVGIAIATVVVLAGLALLLRALEISTSQRRGHIGLP